MWRKRNSSGSERGYITTPAAVHHRGQAHVGSDVIKPVRVVRDLGVQNWPNQQVGKVAGVCVYPLRLVQCIRCDAMSIISWCSAQLDAASRLESLDHCQQTGSLQFSSRVVCTIAPIEPLRGWSHIILGHRIACMHTTIDRYVQLWPTLIATRQTIHFSLSLLHTYLHWYSLPH